MPVVDKQFCWIPMLFLPVHLSCSQCRENKKTGFLKYKYFPDFSFSVLRCNSVMKSVVVTKFSGRTTVRNSPANKTIRVWARAETRETHPFYWEFILPRRQQLFMKSDKINDELVARNVEQAIHLYYFYKRTLQHYVTWWSLTRRNTCQFQCIV